MKQGLKCNFDSIQVLGMQFHSALELSSSHSINDFEFLALIFFNIQNFEKKEEEEHNPYLSAIFSVSLPSFISYILAGLLDLVHCT